MTKTQLYACAAPATVSAKRFFTQPLSVRMGRRKPLCASPETGLKKYAGRGGRLY
jgi:hypothetical protein